MTEKPIKMNWENLDLLIKALNPEFAINQLRIFSWGFEKHYLNESIKPFIRCEKHNLIKKLYLDDAVNADLDFIGSVEMAIKWKPSDKSKCNGAACHIYKIFNQEFEKKMNIYGSCRDKK